MSSGGGGIIASLLEALGDELLAPDAKQALRKRVMRPLMLMVMWEIIPWLVGAWAVATLCSSLATTAALRVFFVPTVRFVSP